MFPWPMVGLAVLVVLLVGLLVAWGVRLLEGRNRAETQAERIQTAVGEEIARAVPPDDAAILPVATLPVEGRPSLELTGSVSSADARRRALDAAERALARVRPGMEIVDHLTVAPTRADRRRA